jgi:hypothetical protein
MSERKSAPLYSDIKKRIEQYLDRVSAETPIKTLKGQAVDLGSLAREVVSKNLEHFRTLFNGQATILNREKIKRVYSREEIRILVQNCLIRDYQIPSVIDAVTEHLYELISLDEHLPPEN